MEKTDLNTAARPLAVDVVTAARMTSLSPHTIRLYIRTGRLRVTRCGRRVLVPVESLAELVREGAPSRNTGEATVKQEKRQDEYANSTPAPA